MKAPLLNWTNFFCQGGAEVSDLKLTKQIWLESVMRKHTEKKLSNYFLQLERYWVRVNDENQAGK